MTGACPIVPRGAPRAGRTLDPHRAARRPRPDNQDRGSAGIEHADQRTGPARHTAEPRHPCRCGRQHQAAHPRGRLVGQLLSERAAPRDAEHIHPLVAETVEQVLDHPGQPRHAARAVELARVPGAGRVKADRVDTAALQLPVERVPHLDVAPHAHDQKQGRPPAHGPNAEADAVDVDESVEGRLAGVRGHGCPSVRGLPPRATCSGHRAVSARSHSRPRRRCATAP